LKDEVEKNKNALKQLEEDKIIAAQLLKLETDQDYNTALYTLGNMYYMGDGVPQDISTAKTLYTKAVNNGNSKAIIKLAVLNFNELIKTKNSWIPQNGNSFIFYNVFKKAFNETISLFSNFYDIHFLEVDNSILRNVKTKKSFKHLPIFSNLQPDEFPLLILDYSVFNNTKTGALFTSKAIHFIINQFIKNSVETIPYHDITNISFNKESSGYSIIVNKIDIGYSVQNQKDANLLIFFLEELINLFRDFADLT
jgi:hypothetical protein